MDGSSYLFHLSGHDIYYSFADIGNLVGMVFLVDYLYKPSGLDDGFRVFYYRREQFLKLVYVDNLWQMR